MKLLDYVLVVAAFVSGLAFLGSVAVSLLTVLGALLGLCPIWPRDINVLGVPLAAVIIFCIASNATGIRLGRIQPSSSLPQRIRP